MPTSPPLSEHNAEVLPRIGHWAAGLAFLAVLVHLFAITSRVPTLTIAGLAIAIVLAALVFYLSLRTYVRIKGTPFRALRTFYLLLTPVAAVGGLLMLKELLHAAGVGLS